MKNLELREKELMTKHAKKYLKCSQNLINLKKKLRIKKLKSYKKNIFQSMNPYYSKKSVKLFGLHKKIRSEESSTQVIEDRRIRGSKDLRLREHGSQIYKKNLRRRETNNFISHLHCYRVALSSALTSIFARFMSRPRCSMN